jgi:hypothetical protein
MKPEAEASGYLILREQAKAKAKTRASGDSKTAAAGEGHETRG